MQRFNSTIRQKTGICHQCKDNKEKPLIASLCQYHYKIFREEERRKKAKERTHMEVVKIVNKGKSELVLWYEEIMNREEPFCWECGKRINKENKLVWHGSIAHCLPKSLFPSVATHPMNYLILGMYCCHSTYDQHWEAASKMKVFAKAKERFKLFEDDIALDEFRRVPHIFLT